MRIVAPSVSLTGPPKTTKGEDLSIELLRNPWKVKIPTLTASCKICCRKQSPTGVLELRRVHPLECLRLQGWDLGMWSGDVVPIKSLGGPWGPEELQDLAGNMWNAFSYTRIKMAAVGAVDWVEVNRRKAAKQLEDEACNGDLTDTDLESFLD